MKRFHFIITVIVFLLNDFLGNYLAEMERMKEWLEGFDISIASFRFALVFVNLIVGAIYFRRYAPLLIQSIWIILYLLIITYYTIRWCINGIGLLSDTFSQNSHLTLGLSVFSFLFFYLINKIFIKKIKLKNP